MTTPPRAHMALAAADGDDVVISFTVNNRVEAYTMKRAAAARLVERIAKALAADRS